MVVLTGTLTHTITHPASVLFFLLGKKKQKREENETGWKIAEIEKISDWLSVIGLLHRKDQEKMYKNAIGLAGETQVKTKRKANNKYQQKTK